MCLCNTCKSIKCNRTDYIAVSSQVTLGFMLTLKNKWAKWLMRWWFRSENNVNIFLPCSSQFSLFLCVSRGSCLARNLLLLIIFSLFWTLGWNCWVCSFSLLRPWVGFLHYIVLAVCSISGLRLQQFYAGSLLPVCYQLWTSSETCSTFSTTHQLFVVFQRKGLPAHLPTPSPRTFSNNSLILTSCLNTLSKAPLKPSL